MVKSCVKRRESNRERYARIPIWKNFPMAQDVVVGKPSAMSSEGPQGVNNLVYAY